jgi:hypothetical protein
VKIVGGKVGSRYRIAVDAPADGDHFDAKVPWSFFRYT